MTLKLQFVVEAIDNATAKVREVNRAVEKSREPWLKVRASAREFFNEAGFTKLQRQMETIRQRGAGIVTWGRNAATALLGVGAAGAAAFAGVKGIADGVDRLADTAAALSITTQQLQRAGFAAQMNGSSVDELGQSLVFLNKNMAMAREGNAEMMQWMRRAGVSAADLRNRNFTALDVMERMADTFQRVGDKGDNGQRKIAMTTQLMGRQGFRMIQLLNGGSAALRGYYEEADRLGVTLEDRTIKSMGAFNDSLDRLRLVSFGAAAAAGAPLARVLERLAERVTGWTAANRGLMETRLDVYMGRVEQRLPPLLDGLGQVMGVLGGFLSMVDDVANLVGGWGNALKIVGVLIAAKFVIDLGLLVAAVATALPVLGGLATALWGIAAGFTAAMAWPLLFAAVLGGAAYIIFKQWKPIGEFFSGLWAKVDSLAGAGARLFGLGGAPGGASAVAAAGVSAIPTGGMNRVGGELRIAITGAPARVESLRKTSGSLLDLAVDTGPAMSGAY